jgi:hypothetical protein
MHSSAGLRIAGVYLVIAGIPEGLFFVDMPTRAVGGLMVVAGIYLIVRRGITLHRRRDLTFVSWIKWHSPQSISTGQRKMRSR